MRVIAGKLRGLRIRTPTTDAVRPTYDRVRESLFSMLEPEIPGAAVLDLFAGSGSLGIESLSRGAERATFVEADRAVIGFVRENVERLGIVTDSTVVGGDAFALLERGVPGGPFDLVFVDPPYSKGMTEKALSLLGRSGQLSEGAVIVVERAAVDPAPDRAGRLERTRTRTYGSTALDLYVARARSPEKEEQR